MFKCTAESINEVMNSIHDALFIHDSDTREIIFVNKRVCELYNCTPEEALNISIGKFSLGTKPYSEEDAGRWLIKAREEGEQVFDWVARKMSGETFWAQVVLRFSEIENKKYIVAVVRDISERKKTEFENQKTLAQLQAILNASTDVVAIINSDGVFLGGNKAFLLRWEKTYDQIIGHSASEILPENIFNSRLDKIRQVIKTKESITFCDEYEGKWFENTVSPVVETDNVVISVAMFSKNITDRKKAEDELRESEKRYRLLFEKNPVPMLIYERITLQILAVNESFLGHYGYSPDRVSSMKLHDLYPEEQKKPIIELTERIRGHAYAGEWKHYKADGSLIDILAASHDINYENKDARIAVINDITERKKSELALRESEEKYRTLIESATDSIIIIKDGLVQFANHVLVEMSGYNESEIIGQSFIKFVSSNDREKVQENYLRRLKGDNAAMGYEINALKKNGHEIPLEVTASVFTYQGEKAELVFLHDITERKENENKLLLQKQELDSIYNTVGDVVFQLTVENGNVFRFNSVNKTFVTTTGIDASMVIGKTVKEIIPEPSLSIVLQNYTQAIERKTIVRWEETTEYPAGALTGVVSVAPVFDQNGKCTHLVGSVHDITERKIIENQIKKLNEELEERVKLRTVQLENANKELEAFAYSVSHDLRAPLRAISGFTKILTEDYSEKIEADGKRICDIIQSETSRMGQLIDDLLAFSRLSRSSMQTEPTNMKALVGQLFDETKTQYEDKKVNFILGDLIPATVDISLMRQAWLNLISNAFKFSSKKDIIEIEIGSYEKGGEVIYFIKDKGAGFEMKYVNKLFGVFQRLHTLSEFQGTGVGLAIVQRIIHRHGGKVWAEGEVNKGATIYFSIPGKK